MGPHPTLQLCSAPPSPPSLESPTIVKARMDGLQIPGKPALLCVPVSGRVKLSCVLVTSLCVQVVSVSRFFVALCIFSVLR